MTRQSSRILIVEDSESLAQTYAGILEGDGHEVKVAGSGEDANAALESAAEPFDTVLLDLQLPDCDGLEWLEGRQQLTSDCSVVVITADGSITRAISAMRLGSYDFLVKPLSPPRLLTTVRNAIERRSLVEKAETANRLTSRSSFHGFIGKSPPMQAVYRAIENVAGSKATVFITGESGTGKEVAAEAIHRAGPRARKRFVALNCGAIPENLLESELFGHVKGSFTGAIADRVGAAREADGGTLFLDEICEMELNLQVKLLRFLQTGMVQPVGSSRPVSIDVRVICATNRDPTREVAEGRFREDLFYRLAVIPLELPALRDRPGDVELIAQHFLERFAEQEGKTFDPLGPEIVKELASRQWPGNVRELQNLMLRTTVMNAGPHLTVADLPAERRAGAQMAPRIEPTAQAPAHASQFAEPRTLAEIERAAVEAAISRAGGSIPAAAKELDVSASTIYRMRSRWEKLERRSAPMAAPQDFN
ncbi:sigma-54-dependent Fis family transcriptional regulator [Novosphingobium sp. PC22D]|uniref:sigma-54-dependent transcriptional regulator n=1 Tax=Novosphingobium sp. PC22D TaxID=1962403 RepID=UPI000BF08233|nr:sigma-54 dependent transcriptional regulator [Novosphingobium sp. PC22D]PEQ10507.1 sigma-54-dependent Fis family transcriptional regulator [Novosphingobium sp. PC22D]